MSPSFFLQRLTEDDRPWVKRFLITQWGSTRVISRGKVHNADLLLGFIAYSLPEDQSFESKIPVGLITYDIQADACEIVTIDSLFEGIGVGTQLILAVESVAKRCDCTRLWLITTNDNTHALRFYQKRGFQLAAFYRDAIKHSRLLKPEIPQFGLDNIPIRDEIELEKTIKENQATQARNRPDVPSPSGTHW
jgi:ribosomal protein S18 acetylase RimI-like enzyme